MFKNNDNVPLTEQWHKLLLLACLSILHLGDNKRKAFSKHQLLYLIGLGKGSKQLDETLKILTTELPLEVGEMLVTRVNGETFPNSFICKADGESFYSYGSLAMNILKVREEKSCPPKKLLNHKTIPTAHTEFVPKMHDVCWFLGLKKGKDYIKLRDMSVADQLDKHSLTIEGSEFTYKKEREQQGKETNKKNKEDDDGTYSDNSCIINI